MSTPTNPGTSAPSATDAINYDDANVILCGFNNKIEGSRRSTIINGAGNYITGRYNTHILGDYVSPTDQNSQSNGTSLPDLVDNAFYLGCANGLYSYGDVVAYAASDANLKDNQIKISGCLEKVQSLDAIEFDWNGNQQTYSGHDIGLIAQQVSGIAPEIVTERQNGYLAMKYEKMVPILVGAIQEQQDQIKVLNDKVEYLLKKIDSMS